MKSKGIVEGLEYRDSTHRYFLRGNELMGVTTAFKITGIVDFTKVKTEVIEPSLIEGDYVHEMAALYGSGNLDEDTVDDDYRGYLKAIKDFFANEVKEVLLIEQAVCDSFNLYAGTPDIVYVNKKNFIVVDDWKTPKKPHPAWGLQTGGYKPAIEKCFDIKVWGRGGVLLKNDGTYERHPHTCSTDFDNFQAVLKVARFKEKHKIRT